MRALAYLMRKRLKNSLVSFFKKPARLIFALFLIGTVALSTLSPGEGEQGMPQDGDIRVLYMILFAFYMLIFILGVGAGFKNGATFFSMADVNLLFAAPYAPKHILIYGLLRQLGTSIVAGFFVIYQYGWMHESYGITFLQLLMILVVYGLVLFCSQVVAMLIYSKTSNNERRQTLAQWIVYGCLVAAGIYLLVPVLRYNFADNGFNGIWQVLADSADRPAVSCFPVVGWAKAAIAGAIEGNWLVGAAGFGAIALFLALFVVLLTRLDANYYEDVLSATEVSFSAITAKKEGRMQELTPQKVKVGKEGIGAGRGAAAFYYKHKLESRRARTFVFDTMTLIFTASALLFAFIMRQVDDTILFGIGFSIYMMLFRSFTDKWVKELLFPYIYMTPEKPFRKLVMILREPIERNSIHALVIGVGVGLIAGAPPLITAAGVLLHFSASLLFIAANLLTERLFGGVMIKWLQMIFYMLVMLITALPGAIAGIAAGMLVSETVGIVVAAAWLTGVSVLIAFLCRNILTWAELNNS